MGDRSPDRADALVWGLTELFPSLARDPQANEFSLAQRHEPYDWDIFAVGRGWDPFNLNSGWNPLR
jgi:hypothetical protein